MGIFGFGNKEIIYFPGCYSSSFLSSKIENYKKILKKIGIKFSTIENSKEIACCGGFLEEAGYHKELRKIAKANFNLLKEKKIKKIITSCPLCYLTLKKYKELLPNFDIEVEFIISTILNAIREDEKLIKFSFYEPLTYYDSCYLSRHLEFLEQPRELLRLFGYNLGELNYNKEETLCCGSCGLLSETNTELSNKICQNFIKQLKREARETIKKIITADNRAYFLLKENLKKQNIEDIQIIDFSDIICDSLGIKKEVEQEVEVKEENNEVDKKQAQNQDNQPEED